MDEVILTPYTFTDRKIGNTVYPSNISGRPGAFLVNGSTGVNSVYPLWCSQKNFGPQDNSFDRVLVGCDYRLVTYDGVDYSGTEYIFDNTFLNPGYQQEYRYFVIPNENSASSAVLEYTDPISGNSIIIELPWLT